MSGVVRSRNKGQGQNADHATKMKSSENQMFVLLLLVSFAFLICSISHYSLLLYINLVDYRKSPALLAGFHLFHSIGQKAYYTNYGINFYLYIISGQKFRSDVVNLFKCRKKQEMDTRPTMSARSTSNLFTVVSQCQSGSM